MSLNDKQERFVAEYLIDLNAKQAAIRAGYSAKTAEVQGSRLLGNAKVQAALKLAMDARANRTEITADRVLKRFWAIATADPNDLIEHRRVCCRHCYGDGGRYQRTKGEMDRDRAAWMAMIAARKPDDNSPIPDFDPQGGIGFDARRPPMPECTECFGDGESVPFAKDTRKVPDAAKCLYAGVKATKDGLEIKLHDQQSALLTVAKHLGMLTERHEVTGNFALRIVEEVVDTDGDDHQESPSAPPPS